MDIVLLVITVVSLGVALVMSVIATRASREERLRAAARVAALRAAADSDPLPIARHEPVVEPVAVAGMRSPAPWPSARLASPSTPVRPAAAHALRASARDAAPASPSLGDGFLGAAAVPSSSSGRQRPLAIAAVLLFVLAVGGGYWAVFGDRSPDTNGRAVSTTGSALELVSLRHERRGAKLEVTGLVRNPAGGRTLEKLSAVVFLFDRQGGFLSSARGHVDYLTLVPGDESPFVLSMDAPQSVARYRVSFRSDAGVVPHHDRRGQEPLAVHAITPAASK